MRLQLSVVAGCALTLTVGACSPDDPPTPTPTTAAPEPANPNTTPPPMPDQAAQFTPNGAASFVSYYVSTLGYASKTGEIDELREASSPSCEGCSSYIDLYESTYAAGGWFKGFTWTKGDTRLAFDRRPGGETRATTKVTVSAGTFKESADDSVRRAAETEDVVTFGLSYEDGWRVTQFAVGDHQ